MRRLSITFIAVLLVAAGVTGCASSVGPQRVQAFAEATSLTVQNVADAFTAVERSATELQLMKAVDSYDPLTSDPHKVVTEGFLPKADLDIRLEALNALKAYAQTLAVLVGSKKPTAFDEQTRALGKALTGLDDALVKDHFFKTAQANPSTVNASVAALNAIGRWLIQLKTRPVVREQIAAMQGPVKDVCALFIADLGAPPSAEGEAPGGLRLQLWNQYTEAIGEQATFLADNASRLDPSARRTEVKALLTLVREQPRADAMLEATKRSVEKLAAAHAKLGEAFEASAPGLEDVIGELYAEAQRVKAFYDSLQ